MKEETGYIAIFVIWLFGVAVSIGLSIGIIWAAIHFISKYW